MASDSGEELVPMAVAASLEAGLIVLLSGVVGWIAGLLVGGWLTASVAGCVFARACVAWAPDWQPLARDWLSALPPAVVPVVARVFAYARAAERNLASEPDHEQASMRRNIEVYLLAIAGIAPHGLVLALILSQVPLALACGFAA